MTRLLDVLVASLILIVAAPVLLVITLLIKCDSPGPIIYGSPRVGRHGKEFRLLRFRTVDISKPAHLSMQERLTRVGSFIRNYSLDDLPNVFNVLKGELSLVGPRPTEPVTHCHNRKAITISFCALQAITNHNRALQYYYNL